MITLPIHQKTGISYSPELISLQHSSSLIKKTQQSNGMAISSPTHRASKHNDTSKKLTKKSSPYSVSDLNKEPYFIDANNKGSHAVCSLRNRFNDVAANEC
eukprot:6233892-Ditylum_brightwellii.AAC.1